MMKNGVNSHQPLNHMRNRLRFCGQFESATHGQFKSAQGGQFDRNIQSKVIAEHWLLPEVIEWEHPTDYSNYLNKWVSIAVQTKITSCGHQIELKMYEHHYYKTDWKELDRLIELA